ncbi:aldehyde dehydrogenase family protein [Rhabdothermincola sediminis]|uniref:aldehyde dehydrogenase family protein n=1 Tax=Rhabdothermincola sediminis TaxID=2751370 RepID=UPI001AA04AFB|nr:aldehyde dehydrogenase family protein [Rhabdothermincola sediminis]
MSLAVTPMRIGSRSVTTDEVMLVRSPYDGREVGMVPAGTAGHLDAAVEEARGRLLDGPLPAHERAAILDRAATVLAARQEDYARLICAESAKPIKTARVEAARAVDTFRFAAAVARTLTGETVPLEASPAGVGKVGFVLRVPIGVVGAISPFNFPLNLVAHKVAPAIAAGCPVVLKPASATPLTALALAGLLLDECGLPSGWLHVVTCPGAVADHLVTHPDVAMITFTGSPAVGWRIRERAPRKKVSLELGNNSPVVIEPDGDWRAAASKIAVAGYSFAGQSCISVQRVFVHHSIAEPFTEALTAQVADLVVGDPADEATDVSALITPDETERVHGWIDEAVAQGAELRTGGELTADQVLRPTVLFGVRPEMEICRTEVFGPVVGVQAYDDFDHALRLANDTRYGLQAGVFTGELAKALHAARTLDFGGVLVNEVPTWRADQMPYGGVRDSGNTREGPAYAAREMTEERLVVLQG